VEAKGQPIDGQCLRSAEVNDRAIVWHRLKLTTRDGTVAVAIDGVVVNRTSNGPCGSGRIVLRTESCPMDFRGVGEDAAALLLDGPRSPIPDGERSGGPSGRMGYSVRDPRASLLLSPGLKSPGPSGQSLRRLRIETEGTQAGV